jgi:hypothetical protein
MRRTLPLGFALLLVLVLAPSAPAATTFHFFHSPSRNIDCVISGDEARCDIRRHSFRAPPRPRSCDLEWGSVVAVGKASKRGGFACVGDTARDPKAKTLAYGKTIRAGGMRCTSRTDGIRCHNDRGHGFLLARARYLLF